MGGCLPSLRRGHPFPTKEGPGERAMSPRQNFSNFIIKILHRRGRNEEGKWRRFPSSID